jgi:type IV fimbrial biogenesis protein FimT
MSRKQTGATLPEVFVTIALMAVVTAVGLPALASFGATLRTSNYANQLIASLWHARSEAIRQNNRIVLCKSRDGSRCTTAGNWAQGWIVFSDSNRNGLRDANESVIKAQDALAPGWSVSGNTTARDYVIYDANGESIQQNGAFMAGTFTVCQTSPDTTTAIQIVINRVGRPRSQKTDIARCG